MARRHYASMEGEGLVLDPRFLMAEYTFDIMLRQRQVCVCVCVYVYVSTFVCLAFGVKGSKKKKTVHSRV